MLGTFYVRFTYPYHRYGTQILMEYTEYFEGVEKKKAEEMRNLQKNLYRPDYSRSYID